MIKCKRFMGFYGILLVCTVIFFCLVSCKEVPEEETEESQVYSLSGTVSHSLVADGKTIYIKLVEPDAGFTASIIEATANTFTSGSTTYSMNSVPEGSYDIWAFIDLDDSGRVLPTSGDYVTNAIRVSLSGNTEKNLIENDFSAFKEESQVYSLPDTGQTTSYTATFGEDSDYLINPPSFTDNGDGTVTDENTGLMWQQEDDNTTRNWSDAGSYCSNLTLGGNNDWRLPNPKELHSIANLESYNPALNTTVFLNANSSNYWSSTTRADGTSQAWRMHFNDGYVDFDDKLNDYYVRCVRGSSESVIWSLDFSVIGDGTVVHSSTGLTWQQEDDNTTRTWEDALNYCEGLSLGGFADWRLPNVRELQTIVDYSQNIPAVDTQVFTNMNTSNYWSSTTDASNTSYAWGVSFFLGGVVGSSDKTYSHYVRCVRGSQ